MGSRQFLKLCSRQCNGRRSEMPRKWQVQLGPNFIKHNPICALILPKRLAADAALPDEKEKKKEKKEESQEACGSFSKLSVELSFRVSFFFPPLSSSSSSSSSSSLLSNQIRCTSYTSLARVHRLRNFRFEEDRCFDTD